MTAAPRIGYGVGNEHNPTDPWGRTELVIHPDGTALLRQFFSRKAGVGSWTGQVEPGTLGSLWAAPDQAGSRRSLTRQAFTASASANGGQQTITRIALLPGQEDRWVAAIGQHWTLDEHTPLRPARRER
ncbi:MAG TPA: hypothetical protein VFQ44_12725 [Streptosporangiaceae bacterium]|nr:hypothetical protein [Streptosporangiaceae bacterium]